MRKSIIRGALLGIMMLVFAVPGVALAGGGEKGCSNIGTWFGVGPFPPVPPDQLVPPPWPDMLLAGWSVTVTGKSSNEGTNHFEFPTFDPTLAMFVGEDELAPYPLAVRIGSMRGNWERTGGSTFAYTFMGFAYDVSNIPVYIAKISGEAVLINNCQYQKTTAVMEAFEFDFLATPPIYPDPFVDDPDEIFNMGVFYGYRAKVVPPPTIPY